MKVSRHLALAYGMSSMYTFVLLSKVKLRCRIVAVRHKPDIFKVQG